MLGNKKKHSCRAKLRKDVQVEHWKVYSNHILKIKGEFERTQDQLNSFYSLFLINKKTKHMHDSKRLQDMFKRLAQDIDIKFYFLLVNCLEN